MKTTITTMRTLALALFIAAATTAADAQGALKRVYDETIDPMTQIDEALAKASAGGKYVVCQVGGNWCPWCLRFADFAEKDTAVSKAIADNFVFIHVNYDPRKASAAKAQGNTANSNSANASSAIRRIKTNRTRTSKKTRMATTKRTKNRKMIFNKLNTFFPQSKHK